MQLKSQAQGRVIEQMSDGSHSLKELMEFQEHLKTSIQENLEGQLRKRVTEMAMISTGIGSILLEINPDEDMKVRLDEFDNEFLRAESLSDLVDLVSHSQTWIFRIVCKLGKVNDSLIHSNIANLKKSKTLREARESISGKPIEFPLASMDRVLSDIIKAYLSGLDDRKGNVDSVAQKQAVLVKLLRDYKSS